LKAALLINSMGGGGSERVANMILKEALSKGCKMELICLEKNMFYETPNGVDVTYLGNSDGEESKIKKLLSLTVLAYKLVKHVRQNNLKLIQSHMFRSNIVNLIAKAIGGRHRANIVEVIAIDFFRDKKINLFLMKLFYPTADLFIFKSKSMAKKMEDFLGRVIPSKVIYNPCDVASIDELAKEEVDDFSFLENRKYIISVGRLDAQKNQLLLIEAMLDVGKEVELVLLGAGTDMDMLKQRSMELGLYDRVHFLGMVKNPFKYMSRADAFVLSSKSEGYPNALLEAMACAIPVISTDCPTGPREMLTLSENYDVILKDDIEYAEFGVLVPMDDSSGMSKAINFMLSEDGMVLKYKKAARNRALELAAIADIGEYIYFQKNKNINE
jgi:glycosyltransferase involved in cell wall biosynthesis